MDCDLVYALVPKHSLQQTIEEHAEQLAKDLVGRVSESMELEEQGISSAERDRQVQEIVDDILRERGRDFWDV